MTKRRHFLAQTGLASLGLARGQSVEKKIGPQWPIVVFEKPMQTLAYDRMGEELAKMEVQGIEATIRRGGHIEPRRAAEEVPKMVAALAKNGQKALIAACNVGSTAKEDVEFLKILKAHGITRYRMDYFRYDLKKDLLPQLRDFTQKLREMNAMNEELGMQALYQIHAGAKYAGSLGWDAAFMFEEANPAATAVAFDLRHIRSGSGLSWETVIALLEKHLGSVYVKDARWSGPRGRTLRNVPLDTGMVDQKSFQAVVAGQDPMPLSLHMEWGKAPVYPGDEVFEAVENIARDVRVLKSWL